MGYNSHTVGFLWRATRITATLCAVVWVVASGIAIFGDPQFGVHYGPNLPQALAPALVLYLLPSIALFALAVVVKSGRLWAAPLILLIGAASLFKLVLLATTLKGPYFDPPLSCELPARIACALLCVACVYAWEDLVDISRTRVRAGATPIPLPPATRVNPPKRRVPTSPSGPPPSKNSTTPKRPAPVQTSPSPKTPPPKTPPPVKPPPPSTSIPRPRLKRDEPPPSHTPWS